MTTTLRKKILTAAVAAVALGTASFALTTDASAWGWYGGRAFHGHFAHHGHGWYRGFGFRHYAWPRYGFGFARLGCWRLTPYGRINVCIP